MAPKGERRLHEMPDGSAIGADGGFAAIGGAVTGGVGGMATGIVVGVAAPAVVAVGVGYGVYKLAQNSEAVREGLTKAGDVFGNMATKSTAFAGQAVEAMTPVAKDAATATGDLAKRGLKSLLGSVEAGAAALKKKLDGSDQA